MISEYEKLSFETSLKVCFYRFFNGFSKKLIFGSGHRNPMVIFENHFQVIIFLEWGLRLIPPPAFAVGNTQ